MIDTFAKYYIDNNIGRPISRREAHATLDLAEENGLVLTPSNTQHMEAISMYLREDRNIAPPETFNDALDRIAQGRSMQSEGKV